MNILCDRCVFAVRNTVLSKIALSEVRGHDLQRSALIDGTCECRASALSPASTTRSNRSRAVSDLRTNRSSPAPSSRTFPLRCGKPLPGLLTRWLFRPIEGQQARLSAGIKFHLERVVVLPGNVQPSRLSHNPADSECFALKAGRIVLFKIPGVCHPSAFGIHGDALHIALLWCLHTMAPIFANNGHPITG